jgi:hypothetical protein
MAVLKAVSSHNQIALLTKTEENSDFHEIINFLIGSNIHYSLIADPEVSRRQLKQFWETAHTVDLALGGIGIEATVGGVTVEIDEAKIRRVLQFDDEGGSVSFSKAFIRETIESMGYEGRLRTSTFKKVSFGPQWRYLIHILIHCLSSKQSSPEQFSTNLASALVGLSLGHNFNFS